MNDTPTPLHDRIVHEQRHRDSLDPGCDLCAAIIRHPAGDAVAEVREWTQHDQAIADAAVRAQDDDTWLRRRQHVFTVLAALFLTGGPILAFVVRPLTGWHLLAVLFVVAGSGLLLAATHLRNVRTRRRGEVQ